MTKSMT